MKYFYIRNFRDNELHQLERHPSEILSRIPDRILGEPKDVVRSWCQHRDTNHYFISTVEPLVPSKRVKLDNPPRLIHGFIADYDAAVDWDSLEASLIDRCEYLPTWYHKSTSGFLRLVWEFELPVKIDAGSAPLFLKEISKRLRCIKIHAGFDKTSLNPGQYYEIGSDWRKLGDALPQDFVFTAHVTSYKPSPESVVNLPFDKAVAGIIKLYGDRLPDQNLEVGSRVPLFWIDDGIDRIGGQLSEEGVICYSDRAGTPFVNWEEVLGKKYVAQFKERQLQETLGNVWTDGKYYWLLEDKRARYESTENFTRRLIGMGLSPDKKKGQRLSEVGEALFWINSQRRVDGVGPFIFNKERIVHTNGKDILNTSFVEVVPPSDSGSPDQWPFLFGFFREFFDEINEDFTQRDVFFSWFQRFYLAVWQKRKLSGQVMIISGPTGRGKTLLSHRIVGEAVGGHAQASEYLMGKTTFNKSLSEAPLWTVDDTTSACTFADNRKFTEMLKRSAANPSIEAHAKYLDSQEVEWVGRVMLSLNEDAHSLTVVPQQDQSNLDKIIGLRVSDSAPTDLGGDNEFIETTIRNELPYFLHWLVHEFQPPAQLKGDPRYGIKPWFHRKLRDAARDNSPIKVVMETLDLFCKLHRQSFPDKKLWTGTAAELLADMANMPEISYRAGSFGHDRIHQQLKAVEEARALNEHIRQVTSFSTGAGTMWVIDMSEAYDLKLPTELTESNILRGQRA